MAIGSLYAPVIGAQRRVNSAWESAAEAAVEASLPILPGLSTAGTREQKIEILSAAVEEQRRAFVKIHGDAFGCERLETQREPTEGTLATKLHMDIVLAR